MPFEDDKQRENFFEYPKEWEICSGAPILVLPNPITPRAPLASPLSRTDGVQDIRNRSTAAIGPSSSRASTTPSSTSSPVADSPVTGFCRGRVHGGSATEELAARQEAEVAAEHWMERQVREVGREEAQSVQTDGLPRSRTNWAGPSGFPWWIRAKYWPDGRSLERGRRIEGGNSSGVWRREKEVWRRRRRKKKRRG